MKRTVFYVEPEPLKPLADGTTLKCDLYRIVCGLTSKTTHRFKMDDEKRASIQNILAIDFMQLQDLFRQLQDDGLILKLGYDGGGW